MNVLPFRRSTRSTRTPQPLDPHYCRCVVHHPVTAVERNLVRALAARAIAVGDTDHAGYLQLRLDTAQRCPAYRGGRSSEHSEPMGAA